MPLTEQHQPKSPATEELQELPLLLAHTKAELAQLTRPAEDQLVPLPVLLLPLAQPAAATELAQVQVMELSADQEPVLLLAHLPLPLLQAQLELPLTDQDQELEQLELPQPLELLQPTEQLVPPQQVQAMELSADQELVPQLDHPLEQLEQHQLTEQQVLPLTVPLQPQLQAQVQEQADTEQLVPHTEHQAVLPAHNLAHTMLQAVSHHQLEAKVKDTHQAPTREPLEPLEALGPPEQLD